MAYGGLHEVWVFTTVLDKNVLVYSSPHFGMELLRLVFH
jgi:hypothetical protein